MRPEARAAIQRPPSEYFKQLYLDTASHDAEALAFLIRKVSPGHVLLGTDYPADMAETRPTNLIESMSGLGQDEAGAIAGGTAAHLLRVAN